MVGRLSSIKEEPTGLPTRVTKVVKAHDSQLEGTLGMLAINCSQEILVSTGSDNSVKVWDMSSGDFICHFMLDAEATGIVFSDFNPNLLAVAIAKTR